MIKFATEHKTIITDENKILDDINKKIEQNNKENGKKVDITKRIKTNPVNKKMFPMIIKNNLEDKDIATINEKDEDDSNFNEKNESNNKSNDYDETLLNKTSLLIDNDTSFDIKGSKYTLSEILKDDIYKEYNGGYALIFRLEATNYHRYIFIDSGTRDEYKFIKGKLNTVQPIAYKHFKVFHENCREWTVLHTKNFDDVIQMEIGAMMIGRINNNSNVKFNRGDEKGFFSFGGSTILLLVKKNIIKIDDDIMSNSQDFKETTVDIGSRVAKKIN